MGKNNINSQLLTAMLAGAVIGVAAAVLYAPESGTVTRSKIKRGAERASNNLTSATTALLKNARQNIEESSDSLGYLIGSSLARTVLTVGEIAEIVNTKLIELKSGTDEDFSGNRTLHLPESSQIIEV